MKKIYLLLTAVFGLVIGTTSCRDLSIGAIDNPDLQEMIEAWEQRHYPAEAPIRGFSEKFFCQDWKFLAGEAKCFGPDGEPVIHDIDYIYYGFKIEESGEIVVTYDNPGGKVLGEWMMKGNLFAFGHYDTYDQKSFCCYIYELVSVTKTTLTLRELGISPEEYNTFEFVKR